MPHLLIVDPKGNRQRVELAAQEYVLGRDQGADIPLSDRKASRRHARLFAKGSAYFIEDLGSANGVEVQGQPIRGPVRLGPGVRAHIGDSTLSLEDEPERVAVAYALHGITPPFAGQKFMLPAGQLVVGRVDGNDIVVPDTSVSRKHATLTVAAGGVVVEDHDSSNGTFVNGTRVGRRQVHPGERVRFGNVELELRGPAPGLASFFAAWWGRLRHADRPIQIAALIGALAMVLLVLTLAVLAKRTRQPAAPVQSLAEAYEREIESTLAGARELMAREAWDEAAQTYQRALERDPINREARRGLALAVASRRDTTSLALARDALKAGQAAAALSHTRAVRPDGPYAAPAQQIAREARDLIAEQSLKQASEACRKGEWPVCHRQAIAVLDQKPDAVAAQALVNEAESALKARRIPFTPWAPPPAAAEPTRDGELAPLYTDEEVRQAVMRYGAGDFDTALKRVRMFADRPQAAQVAELLAEFRRAKTAGDGAAVAGDSARALAAWEEALKVDATLIPAAHPSTFRDEVRRRLAAALLEKGEAAFARGLYAAALADWHHGMTYAPDDAQLREGLGRLESRAKATLAGLPATPDGDTCAKLAEILAMTRVDSIVHAEAEKKRAACRP